jgi:hypothetical protein
LKFNLRCYTTAQDVTNSTAYFTVSAGVDDAAATCVNASLVRDRGEAVQVDSIKTCVESVPGFSD